MRTLSLSDVGLGEKPAEVFVVDSRLLSISVLDVLSERYDDWVGLLQPDQKFEVDNFSVLGTEDLLAKKSNELAIADIVNVTRRFSYQKISVFQRQYWSYTCCFHVSGLGRIRFVVCFDNPNKVGAFSAFISNRLDWSATRVTKHFLQYHPTSPFYCQSSQRFHKGNSCTSMLVPA
ncbi:MAG: hypothetical protein F6K30_11115 [Cyanothece sp. SIO2G6]|nr:hypothetical protein [Cyanothece sp. SIO2G6]